MNISIQFLLTIPKLGIISVNTHYFNRLIQLLEFCIKYYPVKKWPNKPKNTHTHHIIPKSWLGSDCKENLITIPQRYHFIIHKIMAKSFPDDSAQCNILFGE